MIHSKILLALSVASILMTGCALSTKAGPGTDGQTRPPTSSSSIPPVTQPQTVTATVPTSVPVTVPTSVPVTVPATTTASTQPADSQTAEPEPAEPEDIRTGNAYDTATVRDWMRNGPKADHYPDHKLVFLTFDDGPSTKVTPRVLDVLKANDVQATFFYYTYGDLGSRAEVVRRTHAEGHTIAIHSSSHKYNVLYPKRRVDVDAILRDARSAITDVREILGSDWSPSVYRFPGGAASWSSSETKRQAMTEAKAGLRELGMEYIDWNAMTGDSDYNNKDKSPSGLVKYARKTTRNVYGDVVVLLMHDSAHLPNTAKALQGVIDYYKTEGYEFGILK